MHSLFVALGSAAMRLSDEKVREIAGVGDGKHEILRSDDKFVCLASAPRSGTVSVATDTEESGCSLIVDGYVVYDEPTCLTGPSALSKLLSKSAEHGLEPALSEISAGSFNLAYANPRTGEYAVASDIVGSIPLFFAKIDDGCVVATNPLVILATGLITKTIDWTACASWVYLGHPIGSRHILRDIQAFPSCTVLYWEKSGPRLVALGGAPTRVVPNLAFGNPAEMAELARAACRRVASIPGSVGHLQSAGMDSRLILAAWPRGYNPPCFTYGRPNSTELPIAARVAETRGSSFTHHWPSGDVVADALDSIFASNGLMVYPDRYLIAKRIARSGHNNVVDGYLGDVLLGGTYFGCDRHFSQLSRLARLATLYVDQSVSRIGLDRIASTLLEDISEVDNLAASLGFLSGDFMRELQEGRSNLLEDIHRECQRLAPENDSLGILYRNFLMQNRSRHAIAQQGVMCRQFVHVLYPFTNDRAFLSACLRLRPSVLAYRRFYIQLFKQFFPEYARIPYGETMVELRRAPFIHGLHKLMSRFLSKASLPDYLGLSTAVSANNWSLWLRDSTLLREKLSSDLAKAGIVNEAKLQNYLSRVRDGGSVAGGKIFHVASIARWLSV